MKIPLFEANLQGPLKILSLETSLQVIHENPPL
jgi:hypothetical protein